jgi:hypothetical protein
MQPVSKETCRVFIIKTENNGHVVEHARTRGVEEPLVVGQSRQPHFWWQIFRLRWLAVTLKVPAAALRVRFLRTTCPACWLLDVSRLIASRMVFRAQDESPASCARELGLNPAAPMLHNTLKNNNSCHHGPPAPASAPGPASACKYHLQAASRYGQMLPRGL